MSDDDLSSQRDQEASSTPPQGEPDPLDPLEEQAIQQALFGKPIRIPRSKILSFGGELKRFILYTPNPRRPLDWFVSNLTPNQHQRGRLTENAKGQVVLNFEGTAIYAVAVPPLGFSIWWTKEPRSDGIYLVPELLEFCDLPDDIEPEGLYELKEHLLSRWGQKPIKLNL